MHSFSHRLVAGRRRADDVSEDVRLALSSVPDQMSSRVDELATKVREVLFCRFGIDYPTLQFETKAYEDTALLCRPSKK